ncbi:MAG TPA: branched-chain amino acid ABC transporter permease [Acidimicrobiia bacterium]|nr:branched-chain amino acid ABC transporter permease [Acidimicrobiia bacterium]
MSQLQAAIFGALTGSLFALMALGLSMVWGFLKIINLAHFAMILLGGYLTVDLTTGLGMSPVATILVTVPLMFVLGALVQAGYDRFDVSELNSLLISYGLLIITVQVVTNIWTADFQRMSPEVNPLATQSVPIGPLVFPAPTLLAAGFGVVLVLVAQFVLTRTYPGRALQAFGQDREIASAFGIDHRTLGLVLAGAAGSSAAIAGMLFAVGEPLTPDSPFEWIGRVFAIVILGGIGNVTGTLYAGLLVGAISGVVSVIWSPSAAPLAVFSLVVLALVFRPQGLFPRRAGH